MQFKAIHTHTVFLIGKPPYSAKMISARDVRALKRSGFSGQTEMLLQRMLWFCPVPCSRIKELTSPAAKSVGCGWLTADFLLSHCPWLKGPPHPRFCPLPGAIQRKSSRWDQCKLLKRCYSQSTTQYTTAHKSLPVSQGARPKAAPQSSIKETAEIWART